MLHTQKARREVPKQPVNWRQKEGLPEELWEEHKARNCNLRRDMEKVI